MNIIRLILLAFFLLATLSLSTRSVFALELKPISISYEISFISDKYGNATLGKLITTLSRNNNGYEKDTIRVV